LVARVLLPAMIALLLAIALFWELLAPGRLQADYSVGGDTYRHLVVWGAACKTIAGGFWPFWVPELAHGFPLWASFQWGLASPSFLVFCLLPLELANTVNALLVLVVAGTGIYGLSQRLRVGFFGGLVALVSYALSSFFIGRIAVGHVFLDWPMAWLPWVLWSLDRAIVRPTGARLALGAVLLCVCLLSGHVNMTVYVYLSVAVWTVGRLVSDRAAGDVAPARPEQRAFLVLGFVTLLGTGLASFQWLPFLELLMSSGGVPVTQADLQVTSMPVEELWSLLLPHAHGLRSESNFFGHGWYHEYLGISSASIVWLALLGVPARSRSWGLVLLGLALGAIALGLGTHTPISAAVRTVVPFLENSRTPGRVLACAVLAISLLAARGHRRLAWRIQRRESILLALSLGAGALGLAIAGALNIRSLSSALHDPVVTDPVILRSLLGAAIPLLLLMGSLLVAASRSQVTLWRWPAVAVLALSAVAEEGRRIRDIPSDALYAAAPEEVSGRTSHRFRVFDETSYSNAPLLDLQLTGFHIVTMLEPKSYSAFWFWGRGSARRLQIANAKYVHTQTPMVAKTSVPDGGSWRKGELRPLPRAKLYWHTAIIPDTESALQLIDAGGISIRETLLLHDSTAKHRSLGDDGESSSGDLKRASTLEFVSYEPGRIALQIDNPRDGWLYLAEKFAPGWYAAIDGVPTPIFRAFVAFEAVEVPAGEHEIVFEYRPRSIRAGAIVSLGCLIALVVLSRRFGRRFAED